MSLRTRLTVGVAVLVSVVVILTGGFMFRTAKSELRGEVDSFLEQRAVAVNMALIDRKVDKNALRAFWFDNYLSQPDAATQLLDGRGEIILSWPIEIPIDPVDLEIATRGGGKTQPRQRFTDRNINGTHYRVLSKEVRPEGLLLVGRNLSEVDAALGGIKNRILIFGGGGILLSSVIAWLFASRFTRPVVRLTKAAEKVAQTQDLVAFIDVGEGDSEINRLAESFNIMLEALATSKEQQRRLVEDASHELRTPLTSLRTNIEVLLRAPTMEPTQQAEILADAKSEIEELGFLVVELVELATATSRHEEPFSSSDLGDVAEKVVHRFRRRTDRDISIAIEGDNIREIRTSGIGRAVGNLIENAIKFSPEGQGIEVRVEDGRVAIRDYGPGVSKEDKSRVFDRFFRAANTRSMSGSGLGLSIVAEIIRGHGGEVFVEDPPDGPGTVVGFRL